MENQNQNSPSKFKATVFLVSLAFVALNVAFWGSLFYKNKTEAEVVSAPVLIASGAQDIQIKGALETSFKRAADGTLLGVGSTLKTGSGSYAEVNYGLTVLRLEPDTQMVLKILQPEHLGLQLLSGHLTVDSPLSVTVETPRALLSLASSLGRVGVENDFETIASYRGLIEASMTDSQGKTLTSYVLPFRHEIEFYHSQLIEAYRALQPSKLAKEFKLKPISDSEFQDEWIVRHLSPRPFVFEGRKGVSSDLVYRIKNDYYNWRVRFTFRNEKMKALRFAQFDLQSRYVLGVLQPRNDLAPLETVAQALNTLYPDLASDPSFKALIRTQWDSLGTVALQTPAYAFKNLLAGLLIKEKEDPSLLRSSLISMDVFLGQNDVNSALQAAKEWQKSWTDSLLSSYSTEYELQQRLFKSLMVSYASQVSPELLAVFDASSQPLLAAGTSENLLEVTQQRLEVLKALMASYRYIEAKSYLRNSYDALAIDSLSDSVAAKQVFLSEAELVAQRIAFAESELHGAAKPIDEAAFAAYLEAEAQQDTLSGILEAFVRPALPADTAPSLSEILAAENQTPEETTIPEVQKPEIVRPSEAEITDLLTSTDEQTRKEAVARDLAIQLLINEMAKKGIIASAQKVQVLNGALLTQFRVTDAQIEKVTFSFVYDLIAKKASSIQVSGISGTLSQTVPLETLSQTVLDAVAFEASRKKAVETVVLDWKTQSVLLAASNIQFNAGSATRFAFLNAKLATLPLTFSGTYDLSTKTLISASHALYTASNVSLEAYLTELVKKYTVDVFKLNGFTLELSSITTVSPFTVIEIKNFVKGDKIYSFFADLNNNRLTHIAVEDSNTVIDALTFAQFKDF
jgi:hypothetical protein